MKRIYFLILVFSAFLLSCSSKDSVTNAITETPTTKTLTAVYDESNTSKSISVGDTLDTYTGNFKLTYNDGTSSSSITVTKDMITLDTTTVGEKVATITYDGLTTTTSAIVCTSASAFTVSSNIITAYSGSAPSVVIPRYINGTEITTLGLNSFNDNKTLNSIIANNITSIGIGAFQKCTNLTSIFFPMATSIETAAFALCSNLSSISLPNTTSVGIEVFLYCSALTTVSLPKVSSIGQYAFAECTNLTSVTFGALPTILGIGIFQFIPPTINTTDWTIYVPTGTSSAYSSAFLSKDATFLNRKVPNYVEY